MNNTDSRNLAARPVLERVKYCSRFGVGVGLIIAALAAVAILVRGVGAASLSTVVVLLLFYPVGGAIAGAVVGLLFRMTRWVLGAIMVGVVATLPLVTMIALLVEGWPWNGDIRLTVVLTSALLGGLTGLSWRAAMGDD